jgi:hypothetical protein
MQQIDARISKPVSRCLKVATDEARKGAIQRVVVSPEIFEHLGSVKAGLIVASPIINCVTSSIRSECFYGLAEGAIGVAQESSQLN